MNQSSEWLENSPFPIVISTFDDMVQCYNSLFSPALALRRLERILKHVFSSGIAY